MATKFDPWNLDHIRAYRELSRTGAWPPEHDIIERTEDYFWILIVQSKMCEAHIDTMLSNAKEN